MKSFTLALLSLVSAIGALEAEDCPLVDDQKVKDLQDKLAETQTKLTQIQTAVTTVTSAISNMKPHNRFHFTNSDVTGCDTATYEIVSNCVKQGETGIFDASILLYPGMTVQLIRQDLNGQTVVAAHTHPDSATTTEQVPLLYTETVERDSKFVLQLLDCDPADSFPKQSWSYLFEGYKRNGTTTTENINESSDIRLANNCPDGFCDTLSDPCKFTCPADITAESYTVGDAAQDLDFTSISNFICPLTYTVTLVPDFSGLVEVLTGPILRVFWDTDLSPATANPGAGTPYESTYGVVITGTDAGGINRVSCSFTLTVDTPCATLTTLDGTSQGMVTDNFSGVAKPYTVTPFTVVPAICAGAISYECTGVMSTGNNDYSDLCDGFTYPAATPGGPNLSLTATEQNLTDGDLEVGTYAFTIRGFNLLNTSQDDTQLFTWILTAPPTKW